jgi:hypothetical protein
MRPVRVAGTALAGVALAFMLVLAGCNSHTEPAAAQPAAKKPAAPRKASSRTGDDMVAAVSAAHGQSGIVELKFALAKRPAVGEPVDIDLALTPTVGLERLFARFQASEGLQVVSGGETEHFERPEKDVPVHHKLTVTARADGIYYITAVVLADSATDSIARTFSIPLIAGQGLTEAPDAPPAASVTEPKKP